MKKSIFLIFAAILCSVSLWAANVGFESSGNTMKYYSNLKSSDQTVTLDRTNGTTTTLGSVTALYLKGFACKMYQDADNTIWGGGAQHAYYKIHRTAVAAGTSGYTDVTNWDWNWQNWNNGWRYPTGSKSLDVNLLSGLGSGKYSMTYYFQQKGSSTWRLPSSTSKYNVLKWTIDAPKVTSASCTSNGTGLGTEESPFMIPVGETLTLTVDGEQSFSDANSVLNVKFGDNAYSSTVTYTLTPTTTKQSITIKVKYYNSTDDLSGTEETLNVYFEALEEETNDVIVSYLCNSNPIAGHGNQTVAVGVTTPSGINAPAITGYTFSSWDLGSGVQSADDAKTNPINITTKSGETDYTLVANYNEDLTSGWVLRGSFVDDFATVYDFKKKSGESTGTVAYVSMNLAANTAYEFKVVKGSDWYGNSNTDEEYWIKNTIENWTFEQNKDNCHMKSELAGSYTFKIDYSDANPKVSVYYPDAPVKAVKIAGSMTEWEKSPVAFTIDGTIATLSIELTQGYHQFKIIETVTVDATDKDNWYGNGGTMTRKNCTNWTFDSEDNATIFADADGAYTFEWDITTDKLSVTNMPAFPDLSNQPTTLYFRPSTNWKENNPKYAAYFCYGDIGTDDKWVEMTLENGIYKVSNSDKKYVIVIFVRLDPDGEISWESQWNQTDNLIIPNTPNNLNTCFAFWKNAWDDVSGLWVAPTPLTDANWSAFITAYKGKTINALVERSFNYNQLHTLCLPFDLPTNWLGDEAKAYQLTGVVSNSATELELKAIETATIAAGMPYIVRPTKGSEYEYVIVSDVTVADATAGSYTVQGGNYQVTMQAIAATPNPAQQTDGSTEYWLAMEDGCLYKTPTNKLGLRSIIKMTTTSGAPINVRARVVTGENVETGVEDIITTDTPVKVIENGQLIIIRDGIKYNVQGQVIR